MVGINIIEQITSFTTNETSSFLDNMNKVNEWRSAFHMEINIYKISIQMLLFIILACNIKNGICVIPGDYYVLNCRDWYFLKFMLTVGNC